MKMEKVLVITGGSKGIGLATARMFQEKDFKVVNLSRTEIPLEGSVHLSVDFAVSKWQYGIENDLMTELVDSEQIVLVHNAGLLLKGSTEQLDPEDLNRSLAVNVIAPAILNRLVIPHMPAKSSIVYVGSTLSEKGVPNSAPYVIAKHAVVGMMRSTCQDLVGTGIHTACVCPGFTETEMLHEHVDAEQDRLAAIAEGVTQKRLIEPQEIANTIYFCAQNPVINGALIHANLGQIET